MPKKNDQSTIENPDQEKPEFFSQKVIEAAPNTFSAKPNKSPRNKNLKKRIESIYENAEPKMRLPKKSSSAKFLTFLIFLLAFLAAVSWAGYFMFGRNSTFDENKISLTATTATAPLAGKEFSYQISIKNNGRTTLNNVILSLRYPQGFEFHSANPISNGKGDKEWDLGAVSTGEKKDIIINGIIWDNAHKQTSLQMSLNYRPGDLSVELQKVVNFQQELAPTDINFNADIASDLENGTASPLTINLNNNTTTDIEGLELALILPPGFTNNSSDWKNDKLSLPLFLPSSSSSISVIILPTAAVNPGIQQLKINLQAKKDGKTIVLNTLTKEINVNKAWLSLNVTANNNAEKQPVNFGDKISFTIAYENNGNTELKNVILKLFLDTPSTDNKSIFDWTKIQDKEDGTITGEQISPALRRAVITWTKTQIPALGSIKPGEKGSLEIALPIKQKTAFNLSKLSETNITIYAVAALGSNSNVPVLQSNNLILVLNSDLNLTTSATLQETQPPTASAAQSVYNINWDLTNSWHELTDLQLTAALPENVAWLGNASAAAGDIAFNSATKEIVWELNRLPTSFPKVSINFNLGIKTASTGNEATILEKTQIKARDKNTGEEILLFKEPIKIKL